MAHLPAILLKTAYIKPAAFEGYYIKKILCNSLKIKLHFHCPCLVAYNIPYNLMELEKFMPCNFNSPTL